MSNELFLIHENLLDSYYFKKTKLAEKEYLKNGEFELDTLELIDDLNGLNYNSFLPNDIFNLIDSHQFISFCPENKIDAIRSARINILKNKSIAINPNISIKSRILSLSFIETNLYYIWKTINSELLFTSGMINEIELKELQNKIFKETTRSPY